MSGAIIDNKPPITEGGRPYVFISYSHKDRDIVYDDIWQLTERGVGVWYDNGITAGEVWNEAVRERIISDDCKLVIFFTSENTMASSAIKQEMELVQQYKKSCFTVNLTDSEISQLISDALGKGHIRISDMKLYADFFDEDIIYIKRSSPSYVDDVCIQCVRYGVISEVEVVNVRSSVKRVLVLCKNSSFSNSIIGGVYDYFSGKENVVLEKKLVDKNLSRLDCAIEFTRILQQSIEDYDGFILRVPEKYNEQLIGCINKILSLGKKIVLLDIELNREQLTGAAAMPSYVGSDFVTGGILLGERIGDLAQKFGKGNSVVLLFEGPFANSSAKIRCDNLYNKLVSVTPGVNILRYNLPSLNAKQALSYVKERARTWEAEHTLAGKTVVLFAGIDNIAVEIMRTLARVEELNPLYRALKSAKKLIIAGYDGIRDTSGEVVLKNYGVDFMTVDVVPFKQGIDAGEKMYSLLFERARDGNIYTTPELIEYIRFGSEKFDSAEDIRFLIANKQALIFDLDGTVADTERLHWDAYNVLLAEHGVRLDDGHIRRYIGNSEAKIYEMIKRDYEIDFDEEDFIERRIGIYLELVEKKGLKPFSFIPDILRSTKAECVLVTSQIPSVVNKLLTLWGLDEYFPENRRFCCHDGRYVKRDVYKDISSLLGRGVDIEPGEVALFEDSLHYLEEGQRLGFTVIGVEHLYNRNMLNGCDAVMSESLHRGVFVGLCNLDAVYYGQGGLPEENTKVKIKDFSLEVGGPAANAAVTYARLGGEAYLVTSIGDSPEGILLKSKLKDLSVRVIDVDADVRDKGCSVSFVYVNKTSGSRTIFSGQAESALGISVDFEDAVRRADFVLYDGNLPGCEDRLLRYVEYYDKDLVLDAGSFKDGFPECFYRASAVISSESFRTPDGDDVFALKDIYGFRYAAKTAGAMPIEYKFASTCGRITPPEVSVADTLGAGDIFHGGFCYCFYVLKEPFDKALESAARLSSYSVTRRGVVAGLDYAINYIKGVNK